LPTQGVVAGQQQFGTIPAQQGAVGYGYPPISGHPGAGYPGSANTSLWHTNKNAMYAMIVTAIYLLIALTTPFGLLGIVPVLASIRSAQAGEKLAPFAIGAAALAFIVGMLKLTHHL
jgi:hypothetical protein